MKSLCIIVAFFLLVSPCFSQEYYTFPDTGWSQTQLFGIHNGLGWDQYPEEFTYAQDSVINGITYKAIRLRSELFFLRQENGKVIWKDYNGEKLIYDFSLKVGDTLLGLDFQESYPHVVIKKEKLAGPPGDSLWYLEIEIEKFHPDTIRWLEGVGDIYQGLLKFYFPDAGFSHICTRNKHNQTIYANPKNPEDCNCDYIHGQDHDQDGFRNHVGISTYIELTPNDWPPSFVKSEKVRTCDSLIILNSTELDVIVLNGETGESISPDSMIGYFEKLFFYHLEGFNHLLITHQWSSVYYDVTVSECEVHDCDDKDYTVHPSHFEIPYNGIDNDCNPDTPDDDIDMDGFPIASDCNDDDSLVNPLQVEIPYNGLDDDCNSLTPDDDFDYDGFDIVDDCNDVDSTIYPGATEIPNNGIDEDCDGNDLITLTYEFNEQQINIYPNPAGEFILITHRNNIAVAETIIQNYLGQVVFQKTSGLGTKPLEISLKDISSGMYWMKFVLATGEFGVIQFVRI